MGFSRRGGPSPIQCFVTVILTTDMCDVTRGICVRQLVYNLRLSNAVKTLVFPFGVGDYLRSVGNGAGAKSPAENAMTQANQTEDLTFELGMAGDLEQFLEEHLPGQDHRAAAHFAVAWVLRGRVPIRNKCRHSSSEPVGIRSRRLRLRLAVGRTIFRRVLGKNCGRVSVPSVSQNSA